MWHHAPCPSLVLLLGITFHKIRWPNWGPSQWPGKTRPTVSEYVFHHWCLLGMWGWRCSSDIFNWDHLNFQTIPSPIAVGSLPPHHKLGWWMGGGTTKCLCLFRVILAAWWCEGVALGLDIINSRLLLIIVIRSGGHWHRNSGCKLKLWISLFSLGAKAHARKLRNDWACAIHLIATNKLLCRHGGTSNLGTGTCQLYQTTRLAI